jgi:hypothetical protein
VTTEQAIVAAQQLLKGLSQLPDGATLGRSFRLLDKVLPIPDRFRQLFPGDTGVLVELIAEARRGNATAKAEVYERAALGVLGVKNIPRHLRDYIADELLKQAETRKRGKNPDKSLLRNYTVIFAVAQISAHGFSPTRSPASTQESACSIVATALERLGHNLKERGVEKIWRNRAQLPRRFRDALPVFAE